MDSAHLTEREKMLAGRLYRADDPALTEARRRARRLTRQFNASTEDQAELRRQILTELLGRVGPRVEVEPPFYCDYGENIYADDGLFMNFGCVILDCARIEIGRNAFFGPGVHLYGAYHPLDAQTRNSGVESGGPIRIGHHCWLGGGVIVCAGVTIGDNVVVGAGSVVVRDIPAGVIAAGNPCRVLRDVPDGRESHPGQT